MFLSILEKRTSDVLAADFDDVPLLDLRKPRLRKNKIPLKDLWERFVPFTPAQVYGLLSHGFQEPVSVDMSLSDDGTCHVGMQPTSLGWNSAFQFRLGDDAMPLFSKIVVQKAWRGQGIGTNSKKKYVEFAVATGARLAPFLASLQDGGRRWAEFGARVDLSYRGDSDCKYNIPFVSRTLKARAEALKSVVSADQGKRLDQAATLQDPDGLIALCDDLRGETVADNAEQKINQRLAQFYRENPVAAADMGELVRDEAESIAYVFHSAAKNRPAIPALFLTGRCWPAVVDPGDERHMHDIAQRTGGWHTLAPARQAQLVFA